MSTLFTINKSLYDSVWLFETLLFASGGDAVLLTEDAVLAIGSAITLASFVAKCQSLNIRVYALQDDARLRGVENQLAKINMTDYAGFVELVAAHDKQVAW